MTLTQTAALTKRGLVLFAIFIMGSIVAFTSYKIYKTYYYQPPPPPEEQPTTKFGILPRPNIPESSSSAALTYSLDTQTGSFPNFPKLAKVYFVPQLGTTLLAPEKVQQLATILGFPNGPTVESVTQYHFTDSNGGNLTIDLNSANFNFDRPATDSAELSQLTLDNQDKTISDFKNYLTNKNLIEDSLSNGRGAVTYNSSSQNTSDHALVTIWPEDLESQTSKSMKLPILTPSYNQGLIKATVTKAPLEKYKYVSVDFTFWNADSNSASTYPLKKVDQAYSELLKNQAFIIQKPEKQPISVSKVYLAYLETKNYSPYIQPIYVFEGINFAAYVPAIADNFLSK